MKRLICLFSLLLISMPLRASAETSAETSAELYNCAGVWTNKKCDKKVSAKISSETKKPRTPEQVEKDQKELWLNDLELNSARLKREHGVTVDVKTARLVCDNPKSTIFECRKAISAAEREIEDRKLQIARLKIEEQKVNAQPTPDDPQILILRQTEVIVPRKRKHRHDHVVPTPIPRTQPTPLDPPFHTLADQTRKRAK